MTIIGLISEREKEYKKEYREQWISIEQARA